MKSNNQLNDCCIKNFLIDGHPEIESDDVIPNLYFDYECPECGEVYEVHFTPTSIYRKDGKGIPFLFMNFEYDPRISMTDYR